MRAYEALSSDLEGIYYDLAADEGWVSVGITADTAEFAVQSIRTWRQRMGRQRHPGSAALTITADGGGSNGARAALEG